MTKNLYRAGFALALLLAFSGCARLLESVDTNYKSSTDFSALETYNWWALRGQEGTDPGDLGLIRRLVDTDLQAKGLRPVEANPDFLVLVVLRKTRQVETQQISDPIIGDRRFATTQPVSGSGPVTWKYDEGTMVIQFVRPETNHMVWRGTFKTDLDKATTPEKRTAVIERAVKKIMNEFPPS